MRMVFLGPPGAGKGTQSARLVRDLSIPQISTGEMLRQAMADNSPLGDVAREYIRKGQLVPDGVILDMIRERLVKDDCEAGCIFDGFPRTVAQAQALDRLMRERGDRVSLVLELVVNPETLVERLQGRGREDDQIDVIRKRLQAYEDQTRPVADYYDRAGLLRSIDGLGQPDEVYARIRQAIAEI